jgi:hypothetical protein
VLMAWTPLELGLGEGGFKEGKPRRVCCGFDSASSRHGDGRCGGGRTQVMRVEGNDTWEPPIS